MDWADDLAAELLCLGEMPCDCSGYDCDCGNPGNTAAIASWLQKANSRPIFAQALRDARNRGLEEARKVVVEAAKEAEDAEYEFLSSRNLSLFFLTNKLDNLKTEGGAGE